MSPWLRHGTLAALTGMCFSAGLPPAQADLDFEPLAAGPESAVVVTSAYSGGSRALLIGNEDYTGGWPDLPGVGRDLERMRTILQSQGFADADILIRRNLDSRQLLAALMDLAAGEAPTSGEPEARSRLLVYFAGHGYAAGNRGGYLVPIDAPLPANDRSGFLRAAVNVIQLQQVAVSGPSTDVLFLLDSCFAGLALQFTPQSALGPRDLVARESRNVQIIAAASGDQRVKDDGSFSARILSGLSGLADLNFDGWITATELGTYLRLRLAEQHQGRQTPVFGNLAIPAAGIGVGDMLFVPTLGTGRPPGSAAGARAPVVGLPFRDCDGCPELVPVAAAVLSPGGSDLAVGRFEVSFEEWDRCFAEAGCNRWLDDVGTGRGRMPAVGMTFRDAEQFTEWLSRRTRLRYRLPTAGEWEALAGVGDRAGSTERVGLGRLNCRNCGNLWDGRTAPIGSFAGNELGLHDLLGNVWELAYACEPAGSACQRVVAKGGAFSTSRSAISPGESPAVEPGRRDRNLGFRVVRPL